MVLVLDSDGISERKNDLFSPLPYVNPITTWYLSLKYHFHIFSCPWLPQKQPPDKTQPIKYKWYTARQIFFFFVFYIVLPFLDIGKNYHFEPTSNKFMQSQFFHQYQKIEHHQESRLHKLQHCCLYQFWYFPGFHNRSPIYTNYATMVGLFKPHTWKQTGVNTSSINKKCCNIPGTKRL